MIHEYRGEPTPLMTALFFNQIWNEFTAGPALWTWEKNLSVWDSGLVVPRSQSLTILAPMEKWLRLNKMAGWGLMTFKRRSIATMKTIWNSLVQPQLDYCSQFWSPCDQESNNSLEAVQRHFLSKVQDKEVTSLNYWDMLKALRIYSQERHRERYMAIFLWKVSQGMVKWVPHGSYWCCWAPE